MIATLGQRIEELRKDNGLSQKRLAEEIGITRQLLSMIEIDERLPKIEVLNLLSKRLNVSLYTLITGNDDNNHVVCEELGLSNRTVEALKEEYLYYPQNQIVKLFDILVEHRELIYYLYGYLTEKPSDKVMLSRSEYEQAIKDSQQFDDIYKVKGEMIESILLLSLENVLRKTKEELKGGNNNETSKR